ncbi:hypothetical protein JG687_00002958 [Phytophthora cactorum]|uniref:Jacalin-type lectin domain-containing protein n=2 Tax=Phytophthora cactorum TaxID=29920 RepID=A0A8T1UX06_9STRA|nr:hypothetical protein JG687_00002958 [Phytophthora cactorum]
MEAHWGKKDDHTRVFYLNFGTSAGNSVSAGTQTDETGSVTAPDGYQLGGFFGRDGDEIDLLGVVWTSIAVVNDTATTAGSGSTAAGVTDEDIVLSALYGGPHGNAFSDIDSIKFTQTASSITLRSDKRVDAITLQVATPAEVTMNHGGTGGSDKTLTLGPGEYITSMEAHWGKKDDHTRVFYLKFVTSAGNSIEGGSTTDDNAVAKAPDGFQLAGFYGRAEDEVDQIGAIWTRISAKDLSLADEEESSGSGVLYGTTIRNWVGPTIGQHSDTACYRKSVDFDSNNICPLGYGKEDTNCQAQCPLSYPVQCSLECIPQNDDCVLEVLSKIGSVVAVALNAATGGVFGDILVAYKTAKWAITCAANVVNVVRGLIYYLRYRQTTAPQGDTAELLTAAYQTDVVVYDLPVAVCACLGLPVPKNARFADTVLVIVEGIVKQAITNGDEIISTGENVLKLLTGTGALNGTDSTTVDDLQDLINTNSTCGYELKRLTDHVVRQINDIRNSTPDASPNDVRVKVYKSSIVMNDIPAVTNLCMGELLGNKTITAAFETRDMLRKTFGVIVDQLIDTGTTDMGKDVAKDDYMLKVANMGLVVLSTIDPTGIAYMASQFVQPICGPTAYLGEIDDGRLSDALGLTTVDEAFVGSYGTWTKKGDGIVHLILESVDIYDVKVVVHSGGDNYAEVKVGAGETQVLQMPSAHMAFRTLQVWAFMVLIAVGRVASDDTVQLSETFGGPHGSEFSDEASVVAGETVSFITIRAGERVDGISLGVSAPTAQTFTHGGTGGTDNTLTLGTGEYITSMVAHWDKKDGHTRIFYLSFGTSAGNSVSGGTQTDSTGSVTAPDSFQLAGFYGRDGDEIDLLGAIWASIDSTTEAPGTVAPAEVSTSSDATTAPTTTAPEDASSVAITQTDLSSSSGSVLGFSSGSNATVASTLGSSTDDGTLITSESPSTSSPTFSGPATQLSQSFGGPHGNQFSDLSLAASGQAIASLTVRAGERVDGLTLEISVPTAQTFTHGGTGGTDTTLTLGAGEYITSMEAHWGQKDGHTRIFYLSFGTNAGKTVSGGTQTDESGSVTAPDGYQLGGFFGRDGDEIDLLGVVWTSIEAVQEANPGNTTPTVSDSDIVLSDLYGGPHGVAFSDINSIKFEQVATSITIRADKRVDAVTLQMGTPEEVTTNHGGSGGTDNTLTLGVGEYITSMEAHWGKKDDHTRIFYLNFVTSAGNSISGGTQTDDKATATAPDGFQLAGFYGRAEAEVDQLGAIWTRIAATDLALTDVEESDSLTYGTTNIRNWVGSTIGEADDTACYRKSVAFNSTNICPLGYGKDGDDCIAQCPLSYPVSCSLECIPQNDDCALETLSKIGSVVAVALNAATAGVFGEVLAAYKTAKWAITCVANIITVIRGLIYYLRYRQTAAPEGDTAELLVVAYQTDVVVYDLPIAVCTCLGLPVPANAKFASMVLKVVEGIVKQAITNGDEIISTGENVLNLLTGTGALNTTDSTVDELQDLIDTNSSCGYELKHLTDKVVRSVNEIRNTTPGARVDDIRVSVYKSTLVLNDIPAVTNYCMGELLYNKTVTAAFETRDLLRKTFGVIIDQLIETGTTDMGESVAEDVYMLKVSNMGLVALSAIDPTGIAYMASQFVQPICGPTAYLGEIDDGRLYDALGLTTVDEAFEGSYGTWTKEGDGVVHLILESVDTEDVSVVIHSGGDKYAEVDVAAGDTVTWDATIPELQDKTLYIDRWRPGILGLPGSGGGSLVLWIPRSSEGGHIEMHVRINVS